MTIRPDYSEIKDSQEFLNWYWLKDEMVEFSKYLQISSTGGKFELRDRIAAKLDGKVYLEKEKHTTSKFNWVKENLDGDTVITDNITFGPNTRRFMQSQLGKSFRFHINLMEWMRKNTGKTLADAVEQYTLFEQIKQDSEYESDIKDHNMYNQYTRDFSKDNPGISLRDIKKCWLIKRKLPAKNGFVTYDPSDINLI